MPTVHAGLDDLLRDEAVEILDVAVPPDPQPDLIRKAVELGRGRLRGILAQNPLALSVRDARDLVERCAAAGIILPVNQNMRFDHSGRAAGAGNDRHAGGAALDAVGRGCRPRPARVRFSPAGSRLAL